MILVLVGGVAFAQVEPTFKGDATLSWGIDFGSGTDAEGSAKASHGFKNEASASVVMTFAKDVTKAKGEGDVYAYIDLSKVNLGLAADMKEAKATGKVGAVSAKIVFFGAYVTIYNAPKMSTNYAHRVVSDDDMFKTGFEGFGTKIGYAKKDMMDLDVGLKLVSNGSWEDRDKVSKHSYVKIIEIKKKYKVPAGHALYAIDYKGNNELGAVVADAGTAYDIPGVYTLWTKSGIVSKDNNGKYAFGLDFHMVPVEKYLTVDANFNMTFDAAKDYKKGVNTTWKDDAAVNFGLNLKSSPIDGLNLVLGFDGGSAYAYTDKDGKASGVFAWALGFGADYTLDKVGKFDLGVYVASKATPYGAGAVVDPEKGITDGTDMAMTIGYAGLPLVEGLDVHARVTAFRLLSKLSKAEKESGVTLPLGLNLGAAYTAKITDSITVKPYFDVWGETNNTSFKDDTKPADQKAYFGLAYKLGVEVMPMERLTIDASWAQGSLDPDATFGDGALTPMQHKSDNGKFILSAKVTF